MYKVVLQRKQFFFLLYDGNPIEISAVYIPDIFYNIATDSLTVLRSEENNFFFRFQYLQKQLNVANYYLLQMLRLYPLPDPFHKQIEDEYFKTLTSFLKKYNVYATPTMFLLNQDKKIIAKPETAQQLGNLLK